MSSPEEAAPGKIVREVYLHDEPFLRDHTLGGKQILIGVTQASLAVNAHFQRCPADPAVQLRQLTFIKPIEVGPAERAEVEVVEDSRSGPDAFRVRFRMSAAAAWQDTATGRLGHSDYRFGRQDIEALKAASTPVTDLRGIYEAGEPYFKVGPSFRTIRQLFVGNGVALAELDLTEALKSQARTYHLHPLLTYSAFSALIPLLEPAGFRHAFLPFGIKHLEFRKGFDLEHAWVAVRLVKNTGEMVFFDADVLTSQGDEVARYRDGSIKRLRLEATPPSAPAPLTPRATQPLAAEEDATRAVREYLLKTLGLPPGATDLDANLMELGLASAQLVELVGRIGSDTGIALDPTLFFEYPTLRELTGYFVENHRARFVKAPAPRPVAIQASPVAVMASPVVRDSRPATPSRDPLPADGIAVIGMDGRFAGAANLEQFWQNLSEAKDLITEIPRDHWDYRPWYDEDPAAPDKTYCKWGSFLEGVDRFDPAFFNIPASEANWLDPQVRLLLQSVHAAAEHAGVVNRLRGTATGVFVGICSTDYQDRIAELRLPVDPRRTGVGGSETAANRVSYWLDLRGPSLGFNTACSSSLFALHYACQALHHGECEMAFVSGVNLLLDSRHYRHFSAIRALSPSGRCRPFDAAADGYVPGECVGTVLLKPLARAIRDRDPIHAVIRGSAALHAGHAPSLTAPSVTGQENVLLKAWADAGIDPRTLSYVECHGTGTKLGDAVELAALKKALARFDPPLKSCGVGSVKANLGHTEGAAGIASLLKVILQMKHREIPGMPHFSAPNEHLRLDDSPLYIHPHAGRWEPETGPLRAGVSAFGFSGAYAHVVVEEAPPAAGNSRKPKSPDNPASAGSPGGSAVPIVLSAKNEARLREVAHNLLAFVQTTPHVRLDDLAYTLQAGRLPMEERLAFVAESIEDLKKKLSAYATAGAASQALLRGRVGSDNHSLVELAADDDMAATLEAWFQKGKHTRLLELWVRGGHIDWDKLHGNAKPNRIALPTYPFARERCWIPEAETGDSPAQPDEATPAEVRPSVTETWWFSAAGPGASLTGATKTDQDQEHDQDQEAAASGRLGDFTGIDARLTAALAPEAKAELVLRQWVASRLQCPLDSIDTNHTFLELPLDSLGLVELVQAVGSLLGASLSPALLFEHPSIAALAAYLAREHASELNQIRASRNPAPATVPGGVGRTDDACPLSEGQRGLWALQQTAPTMTAYNCPLCFKISEPLDIPCFHDACRFLLQQHPLLASRIEGRNGAPVFIPGPANEFELPQADGRGWSENQVLAWVKNTIKVPFDLDKDPLIRAALLTLSDRETVVVFTVHHTVFDGSSFALLMRSLLEAYHLLRMGRRPEVASGAACYRDYVLAERNRMEGSEGASRLAFWKEQLGGERLPLELPLDYPRSMSRPFAGQTVSTMLTPDLAGRLSAFGKEHALYASSLFLAVFQELLRLYSGQTDLTVGMPVNERADARFHSIIGYFVNMIPVRSRGIGDRPFVAFAQAVQQTVLAALANRCPFPVLVRELKLSGQGDHPVFQAAFEYQNFLRSGDVDAVNRAVENAFPMTWIEGLHQEGEYELALEVIEQAEAFQVNLKFNPTLLREATAARMLDHLTMLLESALACPQRVPSTDLLLTPAERHTLLEEWNDTRYDYPRDACIHHFFESQARRTPKVIAVVFGEETLTYQELDDRSTRLALQLQSLGVQPDALVGLCLERSREMIVAILGVLKAGGAYLPLDPDYPIERLAFMVGDSKTAWILSQSHLAEKVAKIKSPATEVLFLDQNSRTATRGAKRKLKLKREVQAGNLAYVLYTSGSTGTPKGVMVEHRALCNRILWMQRQYPLDATDRVLQKTPFSFDVSGWEFHWPLLAGARLIVAAPGKHKDPEYLCDLIRVQTITVLHFVPSMLHAFLAVDAVSQCASLRLVFCSGEELTPGHVRRFFERFDGVSLHNLYGPTEAAIDVTYHPCAKGAPTVPIGKPIANVRLYVVDAQMRLLPIGFPGELCLAGDALARGYLNRPDLTSEKFVDNPFEPGAKLYRTGDLARWTGDGEMEYLGRIDHQVKIRGCRIELGEIETAMTGLAGIREAVVVPRRDGDDQILAAFYVASESGVSHPWLRQQLRAQLPEHMIPSAFFPLDRVPLTASGKVDRRALSQRPAPLTAKESDGQPQTPTQTRLAELWRETLTLEAVGIHDSFFDLGGHSLSALSLMAKINAAFHVRLPLATLFEAKCIADLARRLEAHAAKDAPTPNAYLAALQPRGSRPPLFLVPGIGGGSLGFLPLSRVLGPDQPVFLFQPPGLEGEREPLSTIQDLAAFYLDRLPPQSNPAGYCLGGWSMGGVVAYEMACQLTGRGIPVARLILIDSYLAEHFGAFSQIAGTEDFSQAAGGAPLPPASPVPEPGDAVSARHVAAVLAAHQRALTTYQPTQVHPGEVLYFYATENARLAVPPAAHVPQRHSKRLPAGALGGTQDQPPTTRFIEETRAVWKKYLPRIAARFVTVPASHESILREPAVSRVAREILAFSGQLTAPFIGVVPKSL